VAFLLRLLSPLARVRRERLDWDSMSIGPVLAAMFVIDQVKIEFTRIYPYELWIWGLLGLVAVGGQVVRGRTAPVEVAGTNA
jgi:hypothetical protein